MLISSIISQIKNLNSNPISSMLIGILLNMSDELVYFETKGSDGNTLLTERSYINMDEFEMIVIYFDSPLLPHQTKTIKFTQYFNNFISYHIEYSPEGELRHFHTFRGYVYPTLPYKAERSMNAIFNLPLRSLNIDGGWGFEQIDLYFIKYDFVYIKNSVVGPYIEPFLKNLNTLKAIEVSFYQNDITRMEFEEINSEIYISPWGIIRITDEFTIKNYGPIGMKYIFLELPLDARELYVSDDIGEILGIRNTVRNNYR